MLIFTLKVLIDLKLTSLLQLATSKELKTFLVAKTLSSCRKVQISKYNDYIYVIGHLDRLVQCKFSVQATHSGRFARIFTTCTGFLF